MTVTARTFVPAKFAETAQTTQYTAVNSTAIIDKFTATNVSGLTATINVNLVTGTFSPSDSNLIIKGRALAASETYIFPELVGQILGSGAYISTSASAGNAINIRVSGREVT
jgi:hypothetical protein